MNFGLKLTPRITMGANAVQASTGMTTGTLVRSAILQWVTGNAQIVYYGAADVSSGKGLELSSNQRSVVLEPPGGIHADQYLDLSTVWLKGTAGDQVQVAYLDTTG